MNKNGDIAAYVYTKFRRHGVNEPVQSARTPLQSSCRKMRDGTAGAQVMEIREAPQKITNAVDVTGGIWFPG